MSVFIHPDNQNLLWQMLHRSPLVSQVFPPGSPTIGKKDVWFNNVIKAVYSSLPLHISSEDLYIINKETLRSMLTELQQKIGPLTQPRGTTQPKNIDPVYSRNGMKQDTYNDNFSNRQKEYETMFAKPVAPDVNFSENIKDDVITGEAMEDLIERHRKERELEVKMFAPPMSPFLPDIENIQNTVDPSRQPFIKKSNFKVSDEFVELDSENISVELIDTVDNNNNNNKYREKHVVWKDEAKLSDLENKVDILTKRIEEMFSMFSTFLQNTNKADNINENNTDNNTNVESLKQLFLETDETV